MKTINIYLSDPLVFLRLGRAGENQALQIVFDCSSFVSLYGTGTAVLYAKTPAGIKYPVTAVQEGAIVT